MAAGGAPQHNLALIVDCVSARAVGTAPAKPRRPNAVYAPGRLPGAAPV
jgi:hypothetical protein